MKRIISIIFITLLYFSGSVFAEPELRDYDAIEVPAGTFIQVISLQELSTLTTDYTTPLKFISTNDTYLFETNILPKGTIFFGKIEKKNEPIIGTNASMVVRITKLRFKDGKELPLNAYLTLGGGGNLIGGEMTAPEKYDTIPHYHKGICRHYVGVLKWVPGASLKMGEHTTIASGAQLMIVLHAPAYITHTLNY